MAWRSINRGAALLVALWLATPAMASTTSGLPIDSYLQTNVTSFLGAVAGGCMLIGVVVAGFKVMGSQDWTPFLRSLVLLAVLAGLTIGAPSVIAMISSGGALVSAPATAP